MKAGIMTTNESYVKMPATQLYELADKAVLSILSSRASLKETLINQWLLSYPYRHRSFGDWFFGREKIKSVRADAIADLSDDNGWSNYNLTDVTYGNQLAIALSLLAMAEITMKFSAEKTICVSRSDLSAIT